MMNAQTVNAGLRNYSRADCPDSFNVELRRNTSKHGFDVSRSSEKVGNLHHFFTGFSPLRWRVVGQVVKLW
jgi:hypothetical protein